MSALEASCQIATRYDPLNDTDKRASMTITDTLGDTLVSAVAGPPESATLVRTRTYPAGGMTVVTKLPNGTTVTEQYDQLGRLGATTSPDAGTAHTPTISSDACATASTPTTSPATAAMTRWAG